jgi:TolB-like protein
MSPMDDTRGVGGQLAHYRILGKLGAGGMGEVYRARDERHDRDVAVKVLPASTLDDPTARARLVREAKAAAALNHPNICTVYEVGEADGQAYIAMELVEGHTLRATLADGALAPDLLVHCARQLAEALAHAHDRGVVHRDLKSGNVIVTPDRRVKVLDFGLAKRAAVPDLADAVTELHVSLTQPGTAVGTLPYMAPEQLRGQPTQMTGDVWALGVVLYEMAAGTLPFKGQTSFELSSAILNDAPPPLGPEVPAAIRAVIERCLEKQPGGRFRSGGDVRTALDESHAGPSPVAQPAEVVVRFSRRRALWAGGAAALALGSGLAGWWLWSGAAERSLAVLPFENRLEDDDLDYLCDGVADSLIRQMSRLRSLRISNLETVLNFKGQQVDPQTAGNRLGVETVLAGSIERQGTRLLVSARLVDVATGRELWTNAYDRDASDLLDVQEEIATAIINDGLRLRLNDNQQRELVRRPTVDGEAYDLSLQAGYLQRRATEEDYLYARDLLKRALARDPQYAQALAALSATYAVMVTDGFERPTDAWPEVSRYMGQALAIDPDMPEGHAAAHAVAFLFNWDWAAAEQARRRLLETPAGDFHPGWLRALAIERWALGRPDEALQLARRTRELDPLSPYLGVLEADYLLRDGQFDAAIPLYERSIRLDPDNPNAHFGLAEVKYRQGRFDEAIAARRLAHAVAGDEAMKDVFPTARGEQGYRDIEQAWVRLQLDALKTREATRYVSPLDFARAYAQLGQKELTFKYLDASFVDRSPGLVFLKVDRAWDAVRDDPRFAAAVGRVALP